LIMPWHLVANSERYINGWLIGYGALLGPIGGIMIADYYLHRRRKLNVAALYDPRGEYRFTGGLSLVALVSLIVAVLPNLPGFLTQAQLIHRDRLPDLASRLNNFLGTPLFVPDEFTSFFTGLYNYAWFVGFGIAFVVYLALRNWDVLRGRKRKGSVRA